MTVVPRSVAIARLCHDRQKEPYAEVINQTSGNSALVVAAGLRRLGVATSLIYGGKLKTKLARCEADYAILVFEEEIVVKDMIGRLQQTTTTPADAVDVVYESLLYDFRQDNEDAWQFMSAVWLEQEAVKAPVDGLAKM